MISFKIIKASKKKIILPNAANMRLNNVLIDLRTSENPNSIFSFFEETYIMSHISVIRPN